jgi:hypothetical protein
MNCGCGLPLTRYDEHKVACKNGHIWTPDEFANVPPGAAPTVAGKPLVRLVRAPRFPSWLPGAVLGGAALVFELIARLT